MYFPASTKKFCNTFTCASIFIWEIHKCAPINLYVLKIKYIISYSPFISGFLNSLMLLQTITGDHSPIICGTCTYLYNIKDTIRASWFDWFNRAKILCFYSMNGKKNLSENNQKSCYMYITVSLRFQRKIKKEIHLNEKVHHLNVAHAI